MKLLTKEIAKKLPPLNAQEGEFDPIVYLKLFFPFGRYTFYATEFDGEDQLFGYCISALGPDCDEWGYASLSELESIRQGPFTMERDRYFKPRPLSEMVKDT